MQTFKFWIDRGEQKSEEDFLTPDCEIRADDPHHAAICCAETNNHLEGDSMLLFCLTPEGEWIRFEMEFRQWFISKTKNVQESEVLNEFEVEL